MECYNFSRAAVLANLYINDEHDKLLIKFQNQLIDKFRDAINISSLDEVSRKIKAKKLIGSRVYLKGKNFPWVSDFIVLGSCLNWKNDVTESIIAQAMLRVSRLAPIPAIFDYVNKHYVGPICGYTEFDNYTDCCDIPKGKILFWLRDYSYLSLLF